MLKRMRDGGELDHILEAYGGLGLWRDLEHITLRLDELSGPLLLLKGLARTFVRPTTVTVMPSQWRVEFHDFPAGGECAVFHAGRIQLRDGAGVTVLDRDRYRESFAGVRRLRRWSNADAAYF